MAKRFNYLRTAILTSVSFISLSVQAQNKTNTKDTAAVAKQTIRTAADLKSGSSQDVLTSFFKLGYQDLTDGHGFGFSSSLFAVRAKTDSTLWRDNKYQQQVFARNFVFGFNYVLDSNFKFKTASLNLKYAVINNRDKDLFKFGPGIVLGSFMDEVTSLVSSAEQIYFKQHPEQRNDLTAIHLISNFYAFKDAKDKTDKSKLPADYVRVLDSLQKLPKYNTIRNLDVNHFRDSLKNLTKVTTDLMAERGLWTIETKIYAAPNNAISKANFNTQYLKGITDTHSSMGAELNLQANYNSYDSIVVKTNYHRNVLLVAAGINWIIYKDKNTQKSYVEFNPALTYYRTFSGLYPGEKESALAGQGTLRFRISDSLWLPVSIVYDPNKGKVLGFLNITSNFDWLGKK